MRKLKITKGKFVIHKNSIYFEVNNGFENEKRCSISLHLYDSEINQTFSLSKENEDNAKLIVDALNTFNKCGIKPSELLKQNKRLITENEQLLKALEKEINI